MRVIEAKTQVLDLIQNDIESTNIQINIDSGSPDGDEGKFLLEGKPARVIVPRDGFYANIHLGWLNGERGLPVIQRGGFYWYVFALTTDNDNQISTYFICDYITMRNFVLDFDAPLGNTHEDHHDWRGAIIVLDEGIRLGYFRWGDENADERREGRYIDLRNIPEVLDYLHLGTRNWTDEVVDAFIATGGIAHYSIIYDYIENNSRRELPQSWRAIIRREVENHSSDSEAFLGGEDYFHAIGGLGNGLWGLRDVTVEEENVAVDVGEPQLPRRQTTSVSRIIRNTEISRQLKQLYENTCQICGLVIQLSNRTYSECHHLQPLGGDHRGPDVQENLIVVCPNHHAELDYGAIAINPRTMTVQHVDTENEFNGSEIFIHDTHNVGVRYQNYHMENIFDND